MKNKLLAILILCFIVFSTGLIAYSPGKLIITGFEGKYPDNPNVQRLKQYIDQEKVGGVILFKHNIANKNQLKNLINYLTSSTDIFVVIDHEGGIVNRLTHPSFDLKTPSPESFCKLPSAEQHSIADKISITLDDIGINMNLGGVVDIAPYIYQSSICKYKRCFSDSQDKISTCTAVLADAHSKKDILFALKHFPGHGSTPVDSHYNLPNITKTHSNYDFMPYHKLLSEAKYNLVMIGHLMNDELDKKYPASLSKSHINYLKETLNYKGLIITDDLNMGALYKFSRNKTKIAKMALNAGNHLLLFARLSFNQIDNINSMLVKEGKLNRSVKSHINSSIDLINSALIFND